MSLTDSPSPFHPDAPRWLVLLLAGLVGAGLAVAVLEGWEVATRWLADELSRAWR